MTGGDAEKSEVKFLSFLSWSVELPILFPLPIRGSLNQHDSKKSSEIFYPEQITKIHFVSNYDIVKNIV